MSGLSGQLGAVGAQLEELRRHFAGADAAVMADGAVLIMVPQIQLPAGWNQTQTGVWFLAPVGFPVARPDCFWVEPTVRLASGQLPMNTQVQACPGSAEPRLWFSWHLQSWNPATDRLLTYVRVIQERLRRSQ